MKAYTTLLFLIKIMINIVYFLSFENVVNFFIFHCTCTMVLESIFASKGFSVIFFYFHIREKGWNLKMWLPIITSRSSLWAVILPPPWWPAWKRSVWFPSLLMLTELLCKPGWACGTKLEIFDELSYSLCRWTNNHKIKTVK